MGSILVPPIETLRTVNQMAAFNRWLGLEITASGHGTAEVAFFWRPELGQYAGHLHVGLISGAIDAACCFAASTVIGPVRNSHLSVSNLAVPEGDRFVARALVLKTNRKQAFARCEFYAVAADGAETLVATGEAVMVPIRADAFQSAIDGTR